MTRATVTPAAIALLALAGPHDGRAHAGDTPTMPWLTSWELKLEPVEAGAEDLGPIGTSLRDMRSDLRGPTDFDQVFEVPGRPDLLMRAQGGLFAVFPRSVYALTGRGFVPQVPNDTTFYIGAESLGPLAYDPAAPPPPGVPETDLGIELRQDLRIGDAADAGRSLVSPLVSRAELGVDLRPEPPASRSRAARRTEEAAPETLIPPSRTIATDPGYRARRLRVLVRRAVDAAADQAARGRSSSSK
jgi:hypothetical protein